MAAEIARCICYTPFDVSNLASVSELKADSELI